MKNPELIQKLFKSMLLIRRFEEFICDVYFTDVIKSPVHLSIGQEAVASGVCLALNKNDMVANTYRCHATYIAKGGDLNQMMSELYGKKSGCAGGKAGSMHLVDMNNGVLGASAVVGTTIPVSAGYAFALKKENFASQNKKIVASFFGDGATEEGCFSETINFAALHNLPIIFICENNSLAIHTPIEKRWATSKLTERVATYDIKTLAITSGDVFEIYEKTKEIAEYVRNNSKPAFLEIKTYRYREHVGPGSDLQEEYRNTEEYKYWKSKDQIDLLERMLSKDVVNRINREVNDLINSAKIFAENDAFPTEEDLYANVYA